MEEKDQTHRLFRIAGAALDLSETERIRYVREACGDDHELAEQVLGMLAADAADGDDDFLEGVHDGNTPIEWGDYDLIEPIGKGGMGQVFRGRHRTIGRAVAVKVLDAALAHDAGLVSRFLQEAAVVNAVRHPNIIDVTDFIQLRDPPRVAYVMELLSGMPLSAAVKGGPLSTAQVMNVGWQMLDALEAVHKAGVVHRDLKPDNVFIVRGLDSDLSELPSVKIIDFGIAQVQNATGHRTATGTLMGTPAYMAPEQASGQRVGPPADVYAWAEIVYEMLTGKRLFSGPPTSILQEKLLERPPSLDRDLKVSDGLAPLLEVLQRALAPNPSLRPTTAEAKEVLHRLGAATGGVAVRTVVAAALDVPSASTSAPARFSELLQEQFQTKAGDAARTYSGILSSEPDPVVAVFEHARDAIEYALAVRRLAAEFGAPYGIETKTQLGLSTGPLYLTEDDSGANQGTVFEGALRLMRLARPGQALMPAVTADATRRGRALGGLDRPLQWVSHGTYGFKDAATTVELYEVVEPGGAPSPVPLTTEEAWRVRNDRVAQWRPGAGLLVPKRDDWVLQRRLGEGGFGEVWLAEHRQSGEHRVFKFCFSEGSRRALEREVRLVARLKRGMGDRPDVMPILGSELGDAPYFVEAPYIGGGDLKSWLHAQGGVQNVDLSRRLELVAQIADVLAAAHAFGVLHRDVKPSNVLIDEAGGEPSVVLGDFGIGGLIDSKSADEDGEATLDELQDTFVRHDVTSAQAGTVMYMSPERLAGRPASLQADIYALGVILYQLLVEDLTRPVTPDWAVELDDAILKEDLSAMLAGNPLHRLADASDVARRLRRLEARRAEREKALKREASAERARRFRRVAVPVVIMLAAFGAVMTIQARRISREADRANRAAEASRRSAATAARVSDFMIDLFKVSNPGIVRADSVSARDLLDRGAARISADLQDEPLVRSALMEAISKVYVNLRQFEPAQDLAERALALRDASLGSDHPQVAKSVAALGEIHRLKSEYEESERLHRRALAIRRAALGPEHPDTAESLTRLAQLAYLGGNTKRALRNYERALAIRERALGPNDPAVADSLINIGWLQYTEGLLSKAEPKLRRALGIREQALGSHHPLIAETLEYLALNLTHQGQLDAAEGHLRRAIKIWETILEPEDIRRGAAMISLGVLQRNQGRNTESVQTLNGAIKVFETAGATQVYEAGLAQCELADTHIATEQWPAAVTVLKKCLLVYEVVFGADHVRTGEVLNNLGSVMSDSLGDARAAEPIIRRAVTILEGKENAYMEGIARWTLANNLRDQRRFQEAEPWYKTAIASFKKDGAREGGGFRHQEELISDYNKLLAATGRDSKPVEPAD